MKSSDTEPEFAERAADDGLDVPSKPVRDPSLDTLLEGFEDRIERAPKLRTHTPPSAHTDPFPEEPVVASHLTAPISAMKTTPALHDRPVPRPRKGRMDPTFVVEKPERMSPREKLVSAGALVTVASAIGVAVYIAHDRAELPRAEPQPSTATSLAPPPAAPLPVVSSVQSAPAASAEPAASHGKGSKGTRPPKGHGQTVDGRLD